MIQEVGLVGLSMNFLRGKGEIYCLSWSNGICYGGLLGGLMLGYNWGILENSCWVEFNDFLLSYIIEFLDEYIMIGLFWWFGLQYIFVFKKVDENGELKLMGCWLIFGLYGNIVNLFNIEVYCFG